MDLLKREMERKKKALQEAKKKTATSTSARYMKAGELRRLLEQDEETEPESISNEKKPECIQGESAKPDRHDDTAKVDLIEQPLKKRKKDQNESNVTSIHQQSLKAVMRELRSFGLPITLFGENNLPDRLRRLVAARQQQADQQLHHAEADEFRLGQGHGIRNPFLEKEDETGNTDAAFKAATAAENLVPQNATKEIGKRKTREKVDATVDDDQDPHKRVYRHFKGLLRQWEADLNNRSDEVKRSLAGRNETKTVKQCKDYIRPLFQLCKRRQLEEGLLRKLLEMVEFCEEGEFVRAHDAYMDVAIGRAAWPIGVTMVGIHARKGRAKIESSNVAHVMNSELQRKYLTSVKRLLTYEQTQRTDVDPSKKVMN